MSEIAIRAFDWQDWHALWQLRQCQLAEHGIHVETLPACPDPRSPYEQDYHRMADVYLSGAGNFWLAWAGEKPVGHIGAQAVSNGGYRPSSSTTCMPTSASSATSLPSIPMWSSVWRHC